MLKKLMAVGMVLLSGLTLAACQAKLGVDEHTNKQQGLVAVVKGDAPGSSLNYQYGDTSGKVKVSDGRYVLSVPVKTNDQTIKLSSGSQSVSAKVKKATPLGQYSKIATAYNQAIVVGSLPQAISAQVMKNPAILKTNPEAAKAYQTAMVSTKDQQLAPTAETGLHQLMKQSDLTIRGNIEGDQLVAAALIVPVSAMKDKTKATAFVKEVAAMSSAVGADPKAVLKAFQNAQKKSKQKTTIDTIKSNGVKFDVGVSTTQLYLYVTK
ncbi:hypothetical protein [Lacticaseibacillus saniviri]